VVGGWWLVVGGYVVGGYVVGGYVVMVGGWQFVAIQLPFTTNHQPPSTNQNKV
jgi:hypothetical protein